MAAKSKPMSKQTKMILFVVVVFLVIYIYVKFFKPSDGSGADEYPLSTGGGTSTNSTSTGLKDLGDSTILKNGSKGKQVQWLQYLYNERYATPKNLTKLKEDGIFGSKTEKAVKGLTGRTQISWTDWKTFMTASSSTSVLNSLTDWAKIV